MIQQGVSAEGIEHTLSANSSGTCSDSPSSSQGMTIGKVMDWIEARMEAIKSREEEEDEEEEREREKERTTTANTAAPGVATNSLPKPSTGSKTAIHNKSTREQVGSSNSCKFASSHSFIPFSL